MLNRFSILACQHLLPSQVTLFNGLVDLPDAGELAILPKHYSHIVGTESERGPWQIVDSVDALLMRATPNALILDEGNMLHDAVARRCSQPVGVEQTTNGLRDVWKYPVVLVCRSGAKIVFESQIIANGIARKLNSIGLLGGGRRFLVLGQGAIGSAVLARLQKCGEIATGIDSGIAEPKNADERGNLLITSDVVLGCTGKESVNVGDLAYLSPRAVLVSCSSGSREFESLVRMYGGPSMFDDIFLPVTGGFARILNGGFPINFDRLQEWEAADEIWLTRQLMLSGARQARSLHGSPAGGYKLEAQAQADIVSFWRSRAGAELDVDFPDFHLDAAYFEHHSEGL